jgi:hypothetical protein
MDSVKLHIVNELDDRYQCQSRLVRVYRWLRWYPAYCLLACYIIVKWFITYRGKLPAEEREWFLNRSEYVRHLWRLVTSLAHMKMKYYYTLEEVMDSCRKRIQELGNKCQSSK